MHDSEPVVGQSVWFAWAVRQALVEIGLTMVALVVPGTTAVVYRPQNATEGYIALTLAAALLGWQLMRLAGLRIRIDGEVLHLGRHSFHRSQLDGMRWHSIGRASRGAYRLMATVGGEDVTVCQAVATDAHAAAFTAKAAAAGLPLAFSSG